MECSNIQGADDEKAALPLKIMLLGKSGVGKSASGNTILGRNAFKSEIKLRTVNNNCETETGKNNDLDVTVIDTPGFFSTDSDNYDIMRQIMKFLQLNQPGPHVFVLVLPLGRMSQEDKELNSLIEWYFGQRVWDYTTILFTHGDNLEGKTVNDVIAECDENQHTFIRKCNSSFHVFNNKQQDDRKQVTEFLKKIQIIVALNSGGTYPDALYPRGERKIRELKAYYMKLWDKEITVKEGKLQDQFKGPEFEEKKKELWRKTEEKALEYATYWRKLAPF